jgi:FkbH-like protein
MDNGTALGGSAGSRTDVLAALGSRRTPLTLSQIRAVTRQLRSSDEPTLPLRAAVLHTYTTELLQPYWQFEALLQGFDLQLYEAPYGMLYQQAEPTSELAASDPALVYVFMSWEDLDPRLRRPVSGLRESEEDDIVTGAVAMVGGLLRKLRQLCTATLVVTLLPRLWGPELGAYTAMAPRSDAACRGRIKWAIARDLETVPSALFFDLDEVASDLGRHNLFDLRLWETSRFPFSVVGAQTVVRHLVAYAVAELQPKAKCIVLDADNTLWGGIVGEDGPAGIALGPDYPGSVFVSFQRRLLEFQRRGFVLALCSKNNPQDVAEVLANHPHQLLREEHFAAMRVNWLEKQHNLQSLARELNLGLDSFVFVDDSEHECHAIRQQLPQVIVVRAPSDVLQLPYCLDGVARLEITSLTAEDHDRTRMYAQQRLRQAAAQSHRSTEDYLASLDMVMQIGINAEQHVARIAQLTQKTNQFNLTTQRYSEAQVLEFMRDPDCMVAHFSLSDIFGDSGLVGVGIVRGVAGRVAVWDTLLMSCRVIGRSAEQAFVRHLLRRLGDDGVEQVRARYVPTAKNEMVRDFWTSVGFTAADTTDDPTEHWYTCELPLKAADQPMPVRVLEAAG